MEKQPDEIPDEINKISGEVVDSAMAVHSSLGPGLLESAYEACLAYELQHRGLKVELQIPIPVQYRDAKLEIGFRADMLVEKQVLVELKAVENLLPIHEAQVLTYLKMMNRRVGLLLNFNTVSMKKGIKRIAL